MWMRGIQLIVSRANDPSKSVVFDQHRIDVEVRSTVGWPADTANISIFNLSLEEVKFLQSKEFGDVNIEIRMGYQDQLVESGTTQRTVNKGQNALISIDSNKVLPTVFVGTITNAVGYRKPPEHVTQLFCISKAYGMSSDFKQMRNIPKGATLKDAIDSMCKDYGFSTISTYGVSADTLMRVLPRGRVFHDSFLVEFKNLLSEYNLLYTLTTGEIQIFSDSYGDKDAVDRMSKQREPIRLDPDSVIGNPVAGICTYNLKTFLNPAIQPGMILDVSPLVANEGENGLLVNGVTAVYGSPIVLNTDQSIFRWAMEDKYFIMEITHFGTNFGMEFQTAISAVIGGNTAMGNKEIAWAEMYANSGMASEL